MAGSAGRVVVSDMIKTAVIFSISFSIGVFLGEWLFGDPNFSNAVMKSFYSSLAVITFASIQSWKFK